MILSSATGEVAASTFNTLMDHVAKGFEALGAAILVLGVILSFILGAMAWRRSGQSAQAYLIVRRPSAARWLLAGNRDRGCCAVAAGHDQRRGDDSPGIGEHVEGKWDG